jgi:hypothetical protein
MTEHEDTPIGVPGKVRERRRCTRGGVFIPLRLVHWALAALHTCSPSAHSLPLKLFLTLLCASQKGTCLGGALMWFTSMGMLSSLDSIA